MALNEAGFMTGIGITGAEEYVTFMLPGPTHSSYTHNQARGHKNLGKLTIDGTDVSCSEKGCIKIDLHHPDSLQKIVLMANKCLQRQSIGSNGCNHCPFKEKNNTSVIASLERHDKNREDIY